MNVEQFRAAQRSASINALSSLLGACRRKFLNAASLLELQGPVIEKMREHGLQSIDLWPLMNMYSVACERYVDAFYSPQIDIFHDPRQAQDLKWFRYFYDVLVPHLLLDDAFVRNVLRATMVLPCASPQMAAASLVQHMTEMTLPLTDPIWAV